MDSSQPAANLFIEFIDRQTLSTFSENQTINLKADRFVIGRANNCHLRLPHSAVSRYHAEIMNNDGRYYLVDLDSTNGTVLNDVEVEPNRRYSLKNDDQIQIADVMVLKFEDPSVTTVVSSRRLHSRTIWIDTANHRVFVHGQQVEPPLSELEFRLLYLLYERWGGIVARDQIADVVWSQDLGGISEDMIYNTVSRLRERLKPYEKGHQHIETVRGIGYRLALSSKDDR